MTKTIRVQAAISIAADPDTVWSVWSAFDNVHDYLATVPMAYVMGKQLSGLGATRRCEVSQRVTVDERIVEWNPPRSYAIEVAEATRVPIDYLRARFTVEPDDGATRATVVMDYRLEGLAKFFPSSWAMRRQAQDHLIGLKHHVETGAVVTPDVLKAVRGKYRSAVKSSKGESPLWVAGG